MADKADNLSELTEGVTAIAPGRPLRPDETVRLDRSIILNETSLPARFGRYRVQGRIGVGGFATVYSAVDPELDSPVAIKVLAENHASDVEVRRRFVAEARVARRIGSDRLIGVFDLGETDDGRPYVVMELADRGTLRSRLSSVGRPPRAAVLRLISELGDGMAAIHAKGIVHRDIKPTNLLLRSVTAAKNTAPDSDDGRKADDDGNRARDRTASGTSTGFRATDLIADDERLLLADFGLARDISGGASALTVGGGTAGYMAPEQADPSGKADHRADIYAATVVVAETATGRHAERLDLDTADLPGAVKEVMKRSLSLDRERRPASAAAWREELLAAFRGDAPTVIIELGGERPTEHLTPTEVIVPTEFIVPTEVVPHADRSDTTLVESQLDPTSDLPPPASPAPAQPPSLPVDPRARRLAPARRPTPAVPAGPGTPSNAATRRAAATNEVGPPPPGLGVPSAPEALAPGPTPASQAQSLAPQSPAPQQPQSPPRQIRSWPPQAPPAPPTPPPPSGQPVATRPPPPPTARRRVQHAPPPVGPPVVLPTGPTGVPPVPERETPSSRPLAEQRSKEHLKQAGKLAKLERKAQRKDERRKRRVRRVLRIANFFVAIVRGTLAMSLTVVLGIASVANRREVRFRDAWADDWPPELVVLAILVFFVGCAYFPWPRKFDLD